jgi:outer membrane immunogenic protein
MTRSVCKLGRLMAACAGTVALSAASCAADPLDGYYVPSSMNWAGFYVGGDLGGAWGSAKVRGSVPATSSMIDAAKDLVAVIDNGSAQDSVLIGGAHVGYNVQRSSLVFGLELSFDQLSLKSTRDTGLVTVGPMIGQTVDELSTDGLYTIRGRLGYAMGRGLIYATGGVAEVDRSFARRQSWNFDLGCPNVSVGQNLCHAGSIDESLWTYTVGGGLEFALTNQLSVRAEYLYVPGSDLSFVSNSAVFGSDQTVAHRASFDHIDVARFGLTFRDFTPAAPFK